MILLSLSVVVVSLLAMGGASGTIVRHVVQVRSRRTAAGGGGDRRFSKTEQHPTITTEQTNRKKWSEVKARLETFDPRAAARGRTRGGESPRLTIRFARYAAETGAVIVTKAEDFAVHGVMPERPGP